MPNLKPFFLPFVSYESMKKHNVDFKNLELRK